MAKIRGNTGVEYELAISQGNSRRIQTLSKLGVAPPSGMMLFALVRKHPELLQPLKQAGADPDDENGFHETALGLAISNYPVDVVRTLLEMGANPNKEATHLLPLVWASYDEKIEYLRELLKAGGDPNFRQWNGLTPLHAAVTHGQYEAVKLFLESGADPKIKGPHKKDSIQLARKDNRKDLVELLKHFSSKAKSASFKPMQTVLSNEEE
jgi:ankyrin repeat protein